MELTIADRCEKLVRAFEAKGVAVRANLRPGLNREEIVKKTAALGLKLPAEVIELYQWRNGHFDDDGPTLCFRDNNFISLERALTAHADIVGSYGAASEDVDLEACFPIAEFDGAWYVVACGQHSFGSDKPYPVISVSEGVDLFYYSLAAMLDTCIAWVSRPEWEQYDHVPEDIETKIWKQYNPGIFS